MQKVLNCLKEQLTKKKKLQTKKRFLLKDLNILKNFDKTKNFNRSPAEKVPFIIIFRFKCKEKKILCLFFLSFNFYINFD